MKPSAYRNTRSAISAPFAGLAVMWCCFIAGAAFTTPATAQTSASTAAATDAKPDWSTATIKKVDTAKRRLLLQHGPIPNLGMSGMTMGFEVAAGVSLDNLSAGDSILFRADQIKGQYTVTDLQKP